MSERDWKIDPETKELVIGDDVVMVRDVAGAPDGIKQHILQHLGYVRGEWFIDPEDPDAIPYFERVLVKNPNLAAVRRLYELAILNVPGVNSLLALNLRFDRSARKLTVTFTASTDLGEVSGKVGG